MLHRHSEETLGFVFRGQLPTCGICEGKQSQQSLLRDQKVSPAAPLHIHQAIPLSSLSLCPAHPSTQLAGSHDYEWVVLVKVRP